MSHFELQRQVERVAHRYRRFWLRVSLAVCWLVTAATGGVLLWLSWRWGLSANWTVPAVAGGALATALLCAVVNFGMARDRGAVARKIEARHPYLQSRLLAALEQRADSPTGRFGYLQSEVIRETLDYSRGRGWLETVPARHLRAAYLAHLGCFSLLAVVLLGLLIHGRGAAARPPQLVFDRVDLPHPAHSVEVTIEPGDTEIERGTSLLVLARFAEAPPAEVTLVYAPSAPDDGSNADASEPQRLEMSKSLDDPLFGGRIAAVLAPLSYHVEYAGGRSEAYRVTVFEYPELQRADAVLEFPEYTSMPLTRVEDTRHVTAVSGTRLTLLCRLNKPVATAELVADEDRKIGLAQSEEDPRTYTAEITLKESGRYRLQLVDDAGRGNKQPPEFIFEVTPNRPPEFKLAFPARDVRVSPLEELDVRAEVSDDYGLTGYGLTYSLAGKAPQTLRLGESDDGAPEAVEHQLQMEALSAEPDQLLAYYLWAEDVGPDGTPRRTMSDMYFAEVRHFEEIFRRGEQPPGGQQQQQGGGAGAQQAEKLAELQKQIINGTWNLIRREAAISTEGRPSDAFPGDAQLLHESQQSALEQLEALKEKLTDTKSKAYAQAVGKHMQTAIEQLSAAVDGPATAPLQPALAAEQAAYQALLKLRAREHRVTQGQQGGGGGGGGSRSQQQLQQLELTQEENRYETQRTASPQQQGAQRETRQALNRLRELARRQGDLNERLKELQSALEAAQNEAEREELKRRLKRLREQQQQMLRDVDELRNRMDRPENRRRMADARQQLDRTRENVRRTSEALQQGQVSRALNSGTRAGRELETLRDDFRTRTAGRFNEEMQDMRRRARELADKQGELSERLNSLNETKPRTLRPDGERSQVADELGQQKERLQSLLDEMRRTTEEAEPHEPLLARQLYDAVRKAQQKRVGENLDDARKALGEGLPDEAREPQQRARAGIEELKEGVEKAAESVLGGDAEALERARQELDDLARQVAMEMSQAQGGSPREQPGRNGGQPGGEPRDDQQSQRPEGSGKPGERPENPRPQPAADPPQQGNQPSQSPGGQTPGQPGGDMPPQPGSRSGQPGQLGNSPPRGRQPGGSQGQPNSPGGQRPQPGQPGAPRGGGGGASGGAMEQFIQQASAPPAPLTGDGFREWSDRLRDVEEMIDDPQLRAEAARVRDRARAVRAEFKRHSKEPNWSLVRELIAEPLTELRDRVAEELLRRNARESLVPIDRDPVPPAYADAVREYYERLGKGRDSAAQQQRGTRR